MNWVSQATLFYSLYVSWYMLTRQTAKSSPSYMSSNVGTTKDLRFVDIECSWDNYMDRLDHKSGTDRLKFTSQASKECPYSSR